MELKRKLLPAAIALTLSTSAVAGVGVRSVAIVPGGDGNLYSEFIDGDVDPPPPYVELDWDLSTFLADNGINAIACGTTGTDFSYNVRQHLSGDNAATADISVTTMSGNDWATSGGNDPGSGNNLTFECSSNLDYTGSIRLVADDGTSTDTTSTKTWAAFADSAPPPDDRENIIWEISGRLLDACSNCQNDEWPVAQDEAIDGIRVKHLGSEQYHGGSVPANVAALDHFSVIAGSGTVGADSGITSVDGDNRFFRGTLYPEPYDPPPAGAGGGAEFDPDYGPLNGGTPDKPRIDFNLMPAADAIHASNVNYLADRYDHRLAFSVYLPSDYVEDCSGGWQEAFLQYVSQYTTPNNQFELAIVGSSGCSPANAEWKIERWVAAPGASSGTKPAALQSSTPVTPAMKGAWTHHSFLFNIDNRTSGATPKFEWTMQDDNCNVLHRYVDNTSRWGFDSTGAEHDKPNINLVYKGGWHGYTSGPYDGVKDEPVQVAMDAFRIGNADSTYEDVHPIRCSLP